MLFGRTERAMLNHLPNTLVTFPYYLPGYAGVGRVLSVGRGVAGMRRGGRVAGVVCHASVDAADAGQLFVQEVYRTASTLSHILSKADLFEYRPAHCQVIHMEPLAWSRRQASGTPVGHVKGCAEWAFFELGAANHHVISPA